MLTSRTVSTPLVPNLVPSVMNCVEFASPQDGVLGFLLEAGVRHMQSRWPRGFVCCGCRSGVCELCVFVVAGEFGMVRA